MTTVEDKYSFRILDILNSSEESLTITQMQQGDFLLCGLTSQKMTRLLSHLIDLGFVRKARSKRYNRMVYKSVSKMLEQGYMLQEAIYKLYFLERN